MALSTEPSTTTDSDSTDFQVLDWYVHDVLYTMF